MKINANTNMSFQSRSSTIRFADDIARRVNKEYPRISSTRLECLPNIVNHEDILPELWERIADMRSDISRSMFKQTSVISKVKTILKLIKSQRVGNCNESSFLALVAARANGIKNCRVSYVASPSGYNYDHSVVLVEDEKPYIIDSWLGFADYVPNAIKRYQKDFRNCFDFRQANTDEMVIKEDYINVFSSLNEEFNKKELRKLRKIVPIFVKIKD